MQTTFEVKLEATHSGRRRCLVCDEQANGRGVYAEVYEKGERTGRVICEWCLRLSRDEISEKLREKAQRLEEFTNSLPPLPTYEELKDLERAEYDEFCQVFLGEDARAN